MCVADDLQGVYVHANTYMVQNCKGQKEKNVQNLIVTFLLSCWLLLNMLSVDFW